ncbi:MAG: tRNA lysidine(34) synthetase TilS [Myxococcales bacterium]|nr:MAG: tRNA lysidine(34) synthetase TilS [Myxococcales bacterium]
MVPDSHPVSSPATFGAALARIDYDIVRTTLAAFPGSAPDGPVLCAVSGGSDSMALLKTLSLAAARGPAFDLCAAYVDHALRPQADDEREHVRRAAEGLGVGFEWARVDAPRGGDEARLREQRYHQLERIADRIGARWVATGHTRDDQIETILFRLLRGSGRRGLCGIPSRRGRWIRPLLDLDRATLRAFLQRHDIAWLDDASNHDPRYTRNRIRHELVPVVVDIFGASALSRLPEIARRWREEEAYLEEQTERWSTYAVHPRPARAQGEPDDEPDEVTMNDAIEGVGSSIDLPALAQAPVAVRTRVLRAWLKQVTGGKEIDLSVLRGVEALIAFDEGSVRIDVGAAVLVREYARLSSVTPARPAAFDLAVDAEHAAVIEEPGGAWSVSVDPAPVGSPRHATSIYRQEIDIDPAALRGAVRLRPVAAGDEIESPSGSAGAGRAARKVHDMLQDRRVARRLRHAWPVLVDEARVLWVPGVACAEAVRCAERAERRLRLAWYMRHR